MNKRTNIVFFLLFLLLLKSFSTQAFNATDSTQITLLTCSPGEEIYAKFGHTGVRVCDKFQQIDVVFNYGLFSFNTDNFYLKFIKGNTYYRLGVTDMQYFLPEYIENNQSVTEQVLNFTLEEKQKFISTLLENYEPQNREYLYNFVYDNCATRPRDRIIETVHGHVTFNSSLYEDLTFREMVAGYVGQKTWLMFGIDLIFGAESDKIASRMSTMFLPEKLMEEFRYAEITADDASLRSLVSEERVLLQKRDIEEASTINFPLIITSLLLVIGLVFFWFELKHKRKKYRIFDSALFIITGLLGFIAFYLAFISIHPMVGANYNLLWIFPLNFFVGILLWFKPMRKILFFYFVLYSILILIAFVLFTLNIQVLNPSFIPLILLLLLRSSSWIIRCERTLNIKGRRFFSSHSPVY